MGLYQRLREYVSSGVMPMHMPGHKRDEDFVLPNPYSIDITEVYGLDDLHAPKGVILDLIRDCANFYDVKNTYLLVNGSTSGNLMAVAACADGKDTIIVDEVCHRSVLHAADIMGLELKKIKRSKAEEYPEIPSPLSVEAVKETMYTAKKEGKKIAALVITSPTYEGVVSDIEKIAETVHEYGVPLIVDEAHGGHLRLANRTFHKTKQNIWPLPATGAGADLVVESLHKMLPCLTQCALLHRCKDMISDEKLKYYHDVFTTSSPSYVLMSSIDQCMRWQVEKGEEVFYEYSENLFRLYDDMAKKIPDEKTSFKLMPLMSDKDPSKLVLIGEKSGDGERIGKLLRDKKIEPELIKDTYAVLYTTPVDTRRLPDLNRRIRELQSHALPLG